MLGCGIIASVASAQSLKELRGQESENAALNREAAYTQSVCGNSISASIDWRSAADWPEDVSIAASCVRRRARGAGSHVQKRRVKT